MASLMKTKIRIGTRGSILARTQTDIVVSRLSSVYPELEMEIEIIRTSGDRQQREVIGAFVKELQEALLAGKIDLAVHSMKDLPTVEPPGITIAAVPEREDPREAIISGIGKLGWLKAGMRVGTGSLRRSAQLVKMRPDLFYLPLIGNVDTRLRKLESGEYEAIVMAVAGLNRLNLTSQLLRPEDPKHSEDIRLIYMEILEPELMLPAPGQGALALECRQDDLLMLERLQPLDHLPTHQAVIAERAFLQALGGGCSVPIAAFAKIIGNQLLLDGLVAAPTGEKILRDQISGLSKEAEKLGTDLAERLIKQGAKELLQGVPR